MCQITLNVWAEINFQKSEIGNVRCIDAIQVYAKKCRYKRPKLLIFCHTIHLMKMIEIMLILWQYKRCKQPVDRPCKNFQFVELWV